MEDHPALRQRLTCRPRQRSCRTMSTRRRPLQEGSTQDVEAPRIESPFWSKKPIPRLLSFDCFDDLDDDDDKALIRFRGAAARRKSRLREVKLRQMNRKPGDLLRVSAETERKFEDFLKEMEEEKEDS